MAAPAFTGLSRFPDTRGRVSLAGRDYGICDRSEGESTPSARPGRLPLAVWRRGAMSRLADFADARPGDRVLFLEPLDPFRRADGEA